MMRLRLLYGVLTLSVALGVSGCEISIGGDGDGDGGGGGIAAGFSWTWSVVDELTSEAITCKIAGADYARIQITDSEGTEHDILWLCADMSGETDSWDIATGEGTVTASLLAETDDLELVTLSQTDPWTMDFKSGELRNELDPIEFGVDVWDPEIGADASLTWEWMKATIADWDDPYEDAEYFTETMCDDMGIDYVLVWYWHPYRETWRLSSRVTPLQCAEADQPTDDDVWGSEIYSGLHINDYLLAGEYQLHLGFYAQADGEDSSDVLLYWDNAGGTGDSLDGVLYADDETSEEASDHTNLYTTVFEMDEETVFGVLKIELIWGQSEGGDFDTCADSNVQEMGFLLRNDGWVAAEVPLGDGLECLDWLNFEEVPVLTSAYTLLVSGISTSDDFLWYHLCEGLDPETDVTLDTATGYSCSITNTLAAD